MKVLARVHLLEGVLDRNKISNSKYFFNVLDFKEGYSIRIIPDDSKNLIFIGYVESLMSDVKVPLVGDKIDFYRGLNKFGYFEVIDNSDLVPEGYWEKLKAAFNTWVKVEDVDDIDESEPIF